MKWALFLIVMCAKSFAVEFSSIAKGSAEIKFKASESVLLAKSIKYKFKDIDLGPKEDSELGIKTYSQYFEEIDNLKEGVQSNFSITHQWELSSLEEIISTKLGDDNFITIRSKTLKTSYYRPLFILKKRIKLNSVELEDDLANDVFGSYLEFPIKTLISDLLKFDAELEVNPTSQLTGFKCKGSWMGDVTCKFSFQSQATFSLDPL